MSKKTSVNRSGTHKYLKYSLYVILQQFIININNYFLLQGGRQEISIDIGGENVTYVPIGGKLEICKEFFIWLLKNWRLYFVIACEFIINKIGANIILKRSIAVPIYFPGSDLSTQPRQFQVNI